ncbi:MAG TPA: hypothetical protein VIN06_10810 [Devosia sp.]
MTESTELLKKLQVKAGARLWLVNVPQAIAEALTAGAEVEPVKHGEPCDGVIAFCETPAEVAAFSAQALEVLPEDGLLWFAYRKGEKAGGLSRDEGWQALAAAGYRPVRSISINDTWTGLRFRERAKVKAKEGSQFA